MTAQCPLPRTPAVSAATAPPIRDTAVVVSSTSGVTSSDVPINWPLAPKGRHGPRSAGARPPSTMRTRENTAPGVCAHCGGPLPECPVGRVFCCAGCEAVAGLLSARGLDRYYDLSGGRLPAVGAVPAARSHAWLEPLLDVIESPPSAAPIELASLALDVLASHGAAWGWSLIETFRRRGLSRPGATTAAPCPAPGSR